MCYSVFYGKWYKMENFIKYLNIINVKYFYHINYSIIVQPIQILISVIIYSILMLFIQY